MSTKSVAKAHAKEEETKAAYEVAAASVKALQDRFDNPLPEDTRQSLDAIDDQLRGALRDLVLAKRDHNAAVAACGVAEKEQAEESYRQRRQELEHRLKEAVNTVPAAYRRHAQDLLALVLQVHTLDQEIAEFNKDQAHDGNSLRTFEQCVRWPKPNDKGMRPYCPAPLAQVFEVPALQAGDNFHLPGYRHGGGLNVWCDANGRVRNSPTIAY